MGAAELGRAEDAPPRWPPTTPRDSLLRPPGQPPRLQGPLTLDQALRLALRFNPGLVESAWHARGAGERVRDQSRPPNPTVDVTEENFGGSLGGDLSETTVSASQTLELGGARGARARVAKGLERLALAELDSRQREVIFATGEAFLEAWWLEKRLENLVRSEQIAATAISAANERTRIGAAPPVEGLRAQGVLAEREVERRGAEVEWGEARRRLALEWGAAEADFDSLLLPPPTVPSLPPPEDLLADLEQHPDRLQAAAETAVEAARIREARAARVPDVSLQLGVRHLEETDEDGLVAGLSLPIPLWNTHGALVRAAQAEHHAATLHEQAVRLRLELELRNAHGRLLAARDRYEAARTRAQPAASAALAQLQRGYRAGRFTYLDQLEGQRAAVEAELLGFQTAREVWGARFSLERLLGRTLEEVVEGSR